MTPTKKKNALKTQPFSLESFSVRLTQWVGTPQSILVHTLLFILAFTLILFGLEANTVMLVLTTIVSLEAIYLALFIQMTVNRQSQSLSAVEKDIDEIQEDVQAVEKDINEIQEDVQEDAQEDEAFTQTMDRIHHQLKDIDRKLNSLKK